MLEPIASTAPRRRSLRRAVSLECEVASDLWEGSVPFPITDLSDEGLWIRTALPVDHGQQVLVSFTPPRWPQPQPLVALASVVRVSLARRRSERAGSGMGLRLLDLDPEQREWLRSSLRGLPPPLRPRPSVITPERPAFISSAAMPELTPMTYILQHAQRYVSQDDLELVMVAEGPLLTGGRSTAKPRLHVRASETVRTDVASLPLRLVS